MEKINISQYDKFVQNIAKKGLEQQRKDRLRSTKKRQLVITDRNGKPLRDASMDRTMRLDGFRRNSMMQNHSDMAFKVDKGLEFFNKTIDYSEIYSYLPGPTPAPSDHKINVLKLPAKLAAASSPVKSPRLTRHDLDFDDYGMKLKPKMFATPAGAKRFRLSSEPRKPREGEEAVARPKAPMTPASPVKVRL